MVHRLPVDGVVCRQAHAPVVPRRFRIPLLGEVDPVRGLADVGLERQPRGPPDLLGQLAAQVIGDVQLTPLQRGQARGLVGDRPQDDALHIRGLPPVLIEGLQDQLDARRERDELVRARADRRLLETVVADLLDVLLRHDPGRAGGPEIEGHEVGPRPLEADADAPRIRSLHRRDALLERLAGRTPVALERELDVLGDDRLAVVELHPLAEHEVVDETVRGHRPRLGQARRDGIARHRLEHRVVQGVDHHEGRDDPGGLGRIEPGGGERDVRAPDHLTFGRGGARRRAEDHEREDEQRSEEASNVSHGKPPCLRVVRWLELVSGPSPI